jgi:hypothetical protein
MPREEVDGQLYGVITFAGPSQSFFGPSTNKESMPYLQTKKVGPYFHE